MAKRRGRKRGGKKKCRFVKIRAYKKVCGKKRRGGRKRKR